MNFWEQYKTDSQAQTKGIWREFKGGLSLCIARADMDSNPVYAQIYQEVFANVEQGNAEQGTNAMRELYAKAIVTGAKVNGKAGLIDEKGKQAKFSADLMIIIFKNLPELLKEVITVANDMDNYLEISVKAGEQLGK